MLYKFKSKTTGDVIMLHANGRRVLEIIGKDGQADKGIIVPEQMANAITALEAAIAREEADREAAAAEARRCNEPVPHVEGITLRQRALPLIDMLRRCEKAGTEITWGV